MIFSIIKFIFSLLASLAVFILWNLNCSQTFLQSSRNGNSTSVYIINYTGKHNSLLIKGPNGWKEFSYGDWDVYGISDITFWTGFKSMGLPTQGALGFRLVPFDEKNWKQLPPILGAEKIIPIVVAAKEAKELYQNLENIIANSASKAVFNPQNKLYFVKHPKAYAAWHTCNNMLISWLKTMNVEVKGKGWAGNFLISH